MSCHTDVTQKTHQGPLVALGLHWNAERINLDVIVSYRSHEIGSVRLILLFINNICEVVTNYGDIPLHNRIRLG